MLALQPFTREEAAEYIRRYHRHHRPPPGDLFRVAANDGAKVVGVLVAGRPVNRVLDDGLTFEVVRCCTDGTRNACSLLYGAAWRAGKALGYRRGLTYTLPEEGGASLRAAGWVKVADVTGRPWVRSEPGQERANDHPLGDKWRWQVETTTPPLRVRLSQAETCDPDLFANVGDG